jgi:hypothetical protein
MYGPGGRLHDTPVHRLAGETEHAVSCSAGHLKLNPQAGFVPVITYVFTVALIGKPQPFPRCTCM